MMEIEQVWEEIDARARPSPAIECPLEDSLGLVLVGEARADEDMPAFDRSAMDGYAIRADDFSPVFRVVAEIRAGAAFAHRLERGCAARVFTGGAVPEGARVVMQEDVTREGEQIRLAQALGGEHVRLRGSDARKGDVLVAAGARLGAGEIAVLASVGAIRPRVHPSPRVAHAVTGDEVVACGDVPGPGQIRDSNGPLMVALLAARGIREVVRARWGENPEEARRGLENGPFGGADLLLVSGGASVGDYDFTRAAFEGTGFAVHCARVNSRPGRPLIFASRGRQLAFGLPGNPVSHFACFHLFVARALARLAGAEPPCFRRGTLAADAPGGGGKGTSLRPCRALLDGGRLQVVPKSWNNSGHVAALAGVSGIFRTAQGAGTLRRGEDVEVMITGSLA